jgi:uncharacterized lipoprotein YehR (DUF1307 family)
MKKLLALVLALVVVFSLTACAKQNNQPSDNPTDSSQPSNSAEPSNVESGKKYPNANEDGSINLDRIAHYDSTYDYTQNPKFKIAYVATDNSALYQQSPMPLSIGLPLQL